MTQSFTIFDIPEISNPIIPKKFSIVDVREKKQRSLNAVIKMLKGSKPLGSPKAIEIEVENLEKAISLLREKKEKIRLKGEKVIVFKGLLPLKIARRSSFDYVYVLEPNKSLITILEGIRFLSERDCAIADPFSLLAITKDAIDQKEWTIENHFDNKNRVLTDDEFDIERNVYLRAISSYMIHKNGDLEIKYRSKHSISQLTSCI